MIETADVLALLEDGPHTEKELRDWLGVDDRVLRFTLKWMKGEGQLQRVGPQTWALGGLNQQVVEKKQQKLDSFQPGRIIPGAERGQAVSADGHTRTIQGQEYEVVSDCSGPVTADWPDAGRAAGSSLSGKEFQVRK